MSNIDQTPGINESVQAVVDADPAYNENRALKGYLGMPKLESSNNLRFDSAASETVISGQTNAWIVLGRDRPSNIASGYGGMGATDAAAIDIVAGRASSANFDSYDGKIVSPNFFNDAARVYISQKADLDKYFGLAETGIPSDLSPARSGIGLKADKVRIIGREGIRLVTGKAIGVSGTGQGGEHNAAKGRIIGVKGIELIAGNVTDDETGMDLVNGPWKVKRVQPIPKGLSTAEAIETLTEYVGQVAQTLQDFMSAQQKYNNRLSTHFHVATAPFAPTLADPILVSSNSSLVTKKALYATSMRTVKQALEMYKINYLRPEGKFWICSRFNKTN